MELLFNSRQRRNKIIETGLFGFALLVSLSFLIRSLDDNHRVNVEKKYEKEHKMLNDSLKKVKMTCDAAKMIAENLKKIQPHLETLDAFVESMKSKRQLMTPDKQSEWDNELATSEVQFNHLKKNIENELTNTPAIKKTCDYFLMYEALKWTELKKTLLTPHEALEKTKTELEEANKKVQKLENDIMMLKKIQSMQPRIFPALQRVQKTVKG